MYAICIVFQRPFPKILFQRPLKDLPLEDDLHVVFDPMFVLKEGRFDKQKFQNGQCSKFSKNQTVLVNMNSTFHEYISRLWCLKF